MNQPDGEGKEPTQTPLSPQPLHQLNNALAAILAYVDQLGQDAEQHPHLERSVTKIRAATQQALGVVRELSDNDQEQASANVTTPQEPPSEINDKNWKVMLSGVETLLLIEDEPALCEVWSASLQALDYKVLITHDKEQSLKLLHEYGDEIELICIDYHLPQTTGLEIARELRQIDPKIRLILMSGSWFSPDTPELLALRFSSVLSKPFNLRTFATAIRRAIDSPKLPLPGEE